MTAETLNSQLKWPGRDAIIDTVWDYITQRRWFPSYLERSEVRVLDYRELDDPRFRLLILEAQGVWYHVPLALFADWSGAGIIGRTDGSPENPGYLLDGPYCPAFVQHWIRSTYQAGTLPLLPEAEDLISNLLAASSDSKVLSGEQSNSSVLLGGKYPTIIKFFRVLVAGSNPEVTVPLALARSGWQGVPQPRGYSQLSLWDQDGQPQQVTTACAAVRLDEAQDGFRLMCSLASSGEDPTELARQLGQTTADMHRHLLEAFGAGE